MGRMVCANYSDGRDYKLTVKGENGEEDMDAVFKVAPLPKDILFKVQKLWESDKQQDLLEGQWLACKYGIKSHDLVIEDGSDLEFKTEEKNGKILVHDDLLSLYSSMGFLEELSLELRRRGTGGLARSGTDGQPADQTEYKGRVEGDASPRSKE